MSKQDYDPSEFNIPPWDHTGRSVKIRTRLQFAQSLAIAAILASRRFPYTSRAAFIRHAIQRHIYWLGVLENVPGVMVQFLMGVDAREFLRDQQLIESQLRSVEKQMRGYFAIGRRWAAARAEQALQSGALLLDISSAPSEPSLLTTRNKTGAGRPRP
jgi:hypothetical protein